MNYLDLVLTIPKCSYSANLLELTSLWGKFEVMNELFLQSTIADNGSRGACQDNVYLACSDYNLCKAIKVSLFV